MLSITNLFSDTSDPSEPAAVFLRIRYRRWDDGRICTFRRRTISSRIPIVIDRVSAHEILSLRIDRV